MSPDRVPSSRPVPPTRSRTDLSPQPGRIGPGTRAIVTGASWGIGETFAHTLAARGADLLLVARSEARLRALAETLAERHGVRVETVAVDLAAPDGPRRLVEAADALGFEPTLLVNNAGVGVLGPFAELPIEQTREMIRLNVLALTDLTYRILERMPVRGGGAIVNVGSAAAFQPLPHYGVYAATKAFVASFTAALWAECRSRGVRVVAVCPGAVDASDPVGQPAGAIASANGSSTSAGNAGAPARPATASAGAGTLPTLRRRFRRKISRERVVAAALDALAYDRPIVIPGGPPAVARLALGLLPRRSRLRFTGLLLRRYPTALTGIRRRAPDAQTAPAARSAAISSAV